MRRNRANHSTRNGPTASKTIAEGASSTRRKHSFGGFGEMPMTRQNKKSDLRVKRDHMKDEAELMAAQLRGVKARIYDLAKQIQKKYKRAIKKAAKKIV